MASPEIGRSRSLRLGGRTRDLEPAEDGRQRVVDLVGDPGHERAERGEPIGREQVRFGLLALGNVPPHRLNFDQLSLVIEEGPVDKLHPAYFFSAGIDPIFNDSDRISGRQSA